MDEYISLLMQLKGNSLKEWNRESTRRSEVLHREMFESSEANVEAFLKIPGAKKTLVKQGKHSSDIPTSWEIDIVPGLCRLRVRSGNSRGERMLSGGHPVLQRHAVKRFISLIDEHLIAAALSLFEACAIYSAEKIQKSHPRYWRDRFMNEEIRRLEMLSAKPKETGRPKNTKKNRLQKEDAAMETRANVLLAVQNLYEGKSTKTYQCSNHNQNECSGHDIEEINIALGAGFLNMKNPGTLRNQLSKHGLKFRVLKTAALSNITN